MATPGVQVVEADPIRTLDDLDGRVAGGIGEGGPPVIVAAGGPRGAAPITGNAYPAGTGALLASLDLALTGPSPTSFVLGVDEPLYLSDHGVADGMAPPGSGTVTIGRYVPVGEVGGDETGGRETGARQDRDALRSLAERAGIRATEVVEERYLHRMPAVTALPLAATGGLAGRADVTVPGRPGVFVVGDWVGRRGHLADAVLASAEEAALACVALLDRRPAVRTVS